MKKIIAATLALGLMSGTAMAESAKIEANEPMRLDNAQMDGVSAGVLDNLRLAAVIPVAAILANAATAASVAILSEDVGSGASATAAAYNVVNIYQGDDD